MEVLQTLFWACIILIIYTYLGYGVLLTLIVKVKHFMGRRQKLHMIASSNLPEITMVVAAYNEEECIKQKIENSLALNYPKDKLKLLFVTDGSDDKTSNIVDEYTQIQHFHKPERAGKIAAVNRVMKYVTSPITVFSDANAFLNKDAIMLIAQHYQDLTIGAVAGEKRIWSSASEAASASGESFYWKYESYLKKKDAELNTIVGAAGELFSVRTSLFQTIDINTIIEDFCLTLNIAKKGYSVAYEPNAFAIEAASESVKEEMKRKVRIASGGFQAIVRLKSLLNPFKFGLLTFQYVSHRVLRWTLAPLALALIIPIHLSLSFDSYIYASLLVPHFSIYLLGLLGLILQEKKIKIRIFFIPYYFLMMNWCVFKGFIRFIKNSQSVVWEKSVRKSEVVVGQL